MADQVVTQQSVQRANIGGGVIPFAPPDKTSLAQCYMSWVKGGGLYITTPKKYEMGAEVFVLVKLPDSSDRFPAVGRVVWVQRSSSVLRPPGIGVQLLDTPENAVVRDKIEVFLAGMPADTATFTM